MLTAAEVTSRLDDYLETEFTFIRSDELAPLVLALRPAEQRFVLDWTQRIASTNTEIAHQFVRHAPQVLKAQEPRVIEAWALHAMDVYDRAGLRPALEVIQDVGRFVQYSHERTAGALFDEVSGVLLHFVHGLAGRPLKLALADAAWTDSDTIHLPGLLARLATRDDNFRLYKALTVMQWAQIHHGTLRAVLAEDFTVWPDAERALRIYAVLETLRLEAIISRVLPGLGREMQQLQPDYSAALSPAWRVAAQQLLGECSTPATSLALLPSLYATSLPPPRLWLPELRLQEVATCRQARMEREKLLLRVRLAQWLAEQRKNLPEESAPPRLEVREVTDDAQAGSGFELMLNDAPVAPPETIARLLTSIRLDLSEIPDEYLVPAGPGEYDAALYAEQADDSDAVWQGTYHERGASYYNEWDHGRQHYRKNWCVMREKDVTPVYDGFVADTLQRYSGLVAHLRRSFEAMRDEERLLKRQVYGDGIDIDALVEALADTRDGSEMSDRLFTRLHRVERDIAVAFMVDMSGSTRGWVNDAEREALLLLCEALESLGDRYAIYGFSGITRKRCELYRIKRFEEACGDEVRARISGIRAQDYTRMGFAIRHLTEVLNATAARTRLLITLSDGKPDDYSDYRGVYGIEDTRRALLEARRSGIHPFCITIDEHGPEYLPHMYGAVSYTVVSEVRQLPFKVAEIYRRLTM